MVYTYIYGPARPELGPRCAVRSVHDLPGSETIRAVPYPASLPALFGQCGNPVPVGPLSSRASGAGLKGGVVNATFVTVRALSSPVSPAPAISVSLDLF